MSGCTSIGQAIRGKRCAVYCIVSTTYDVILPPPGRAGHCLAAVDVSVVSASTSIPLDKFVVRSHAYVKVLGHIPVLASLTPGTHKLNKAVPVGVILASLDMASNWLFVWLSLNSEGSFAVIYTGEFEAFRDAAVFFSTIGTILFVAEMGLMAPKRSEPGSWCSENCGKPEQNSPWSLKCGAVTTLAILILEELPQFILVCVFLDTVSVTFTSGASLVLTILGALWKVYIARDYVRRATEASNPYRDNIHDRSTVTVAMVDNPIAMQPRVAATGGSDA